MALEYCLERVDRFKLDKSNFWTEFLDIFKVTGGVFFFVLDLTLKD